MATDNSQAPATAVNSETEEAFRSLADVFRTVGANITKAVDRLVNEHGEEIRRAWKQVSEIEARKK